MEGYDQLASCTVGGVLVRKYRSQRTGLSVCLAQVEGPLVSGYFCLATEAHDDDGLPHTLEHLVFMGSEQYPFKGVLDMLANRCLAQGTNAWTDVDHTCYTVTTAGSEGFLNILPIYLDHILYPTLTDEAFLTEVHHINEEGEDAGVVYCEMQATENTCGDLTETRLVHLMYPGHCGYKSNTGGKMANLRMSTSNEKVRSYHKAYYRPDNMYLIVTGQVEPEQLFTALAPFEEKIQSKGALVPMERPWQSPIDSLESSQVARVPFPTSEEDSGSVIIAWRGPAARHRYHMSTMEVLMEYLTATPVAPLQRDLVEIEEPFCSNINLILLENAVSVFAFRLEGVPVNKIELVEERVAQTLEGLSNGKEDMDMGRLNSILHQRIIKIMDQVEECPSMFFAFGLIGDFLFGDTPEDFVSYLDQVPRYQKLIAEPASFWVDIIKKYLTSAPRVVVLGEPSADLAKKLESEEEARVSSQREALGEEGLGRKGKELEAAIEFNQIPAPDDVVRSMPIPGVGSIQFHSTSVASNHSGTESSRKQSHSVDTLPFCLQINIVRSYFTELTAVVDISSLPLPLKFYLPLYCELLFESPVLRDGIVVPYETVVAELEADTIDAGASLGDEGGRFVPGSFPEAIFISIKVESGKYEEGVKWLYNVLYGLQLSTERITIVANKMLNDISRLKRNGKLVTRTINNYLNFTEGSTRNLSSMITQQHFLSSLLEQLSDSSKESQVLSMLSKVKAEMTDPRRLRLFVAGDENRLSEQSCDALRIFPSLPDGSSPSSLPAIPPARRSLRSDAAGQTLIAGVAGVESNFLILSLPCDVDYNHPDLPAIMVFAEYLVALEGPMWRQIRGKGLSYHYSMRCRPESGLMTFVLFRATQVVQAFVVAKEIIADFLSGKSAFLSSELESARSGVVFEVIAREQTVAKAASQAMMAHFRNTPTTYNRDFLGAVSSVGKDDLERIGRRYFSDLFDPGKSSCSVCCSPGKLQEVKTAFEELGHRVKIVDNIDSMAVSSAPPTSS